MANPLIRAAAWGLARLARYQPVQNGLRKLARAYQQEQTVTAVATATAHDIPEVTSLVPRVAQIAMNTTFRMFPDSTAAKGEKSGKTQLSAEAVAMQQMMRGIHF